VPGRLGLLEFDGQAVGRICPEYVPSRRYSLRMAGDFIPPTGHVFRVERARGPVWYAKYRLPDGRQVQKKIGPAWTERGRPAAGYVTKRLAEDWLRRLLEDARRGTLPGLVRTGATFADAGGGVPAVHRAGPWPQAVDTAWVPICSSGASVASVRALAGRGCFD
jgi:hypothetical protein